MTALENQLGYISSVLGVRSIVSPAASLPSSEVDRELVGLRMKCAGLPRLFVLSAGATDFSVHSTAEELLERMIAAMKISLDDVCVIDANLAALSAGESAELRAGLLEFRAAPVVCLGPAAQRLWRSAIPEDEQTSSAWQDRVVVVTHALETLQQDVTAKKETWQHLQRVRMEL